MSQWVEKAKLDRSISHMVTSASHVALRVITRRRPSVDDVIVAKTLNTVLCSSNGVSAVHTSLNASFGRGSRAVGELKSENTAVAVVA